MYLTAIIYRHIIIVNNEMQRRYDKKLPEIASTFYHVKFPLETCIFNAHSHCVANVRKKVNHNFSKL